MHASHSSRQGPAGRQSSEAASADSGTVPIVTIDNGAVRGLIVPGVTSSAGCPTPLPPPATCGGVPRARRPAGRASATPPASGRAARSRPTPP